MISVVALSPVSDDYDIQHRFRVRKLHKQSVRISEEAKPDCEVAFLSLTKLDGTSNPVGVLGDEF